MAVAVPDGNLSEFTEGLENSYRVESQSSDRTDVTDQYNELEAELESKKTGDGTIRKADEQV